MLSDCVCSAIKLCSCERGVNMQEKLESELWSELPSLIGPRHDGKCLSKRTGMANRTTIVARAKFNRNTVSIQSIVVKERTWERSILSINVAKKRICIEQRPGEWLFSWAIRACRSLRLKVAFRYSVTWYLWMVSPCCGRSVKDVHQQRILKGCCTWLMSLLSSVTWSDAISESSRRETHYQPIHGNDM